MLWRRFTLLYPTDNRRDPRMENPEKKHEKELATNPEQSEETPTPGALERRGRKGEHIVMNVKRKKQRVTRSIVERDQRGKIAAKKDQNRPVVSNGTATTE